MGRSLWSRPPWSPAPSCPRSWPASPPGRAAQSRSTSRPELGQLASNRIHQRGDQAIAEVESDAGRGEKLGERASASNGERLLVVSHGPRPIEEGALPDLEGSELGNPGFDII